MNLHCYSATWGNATQDWTWTCAIKPVYLEWVWICFGLTPVKPLNLPVFHLPQPILDWCFTHKQTHTPDWSHGSPSIFTDETLHDQSSSEHPNQWFLRCFWVCVNRLLGSGSEMFVRLSMCMWGQKVRGCLVP